MKNLFTKTKPDGGALPLLLQKWIFGVRDAVAAESGVSPDDERFGPLLEARVHAVLDSLEGMVNGFSFARAVLLYYRAYIQADDGLRSNVIKWFRGEYPTRTEARNELDIISIVTDDSWYDFIKLFALFAVHAGYRGVLIIVDELVNIFKIPHTATTKRPTIFNRRSFVLPVFMRARRVQVL